MKWNTPLSEIDQIEMSNLYDREVKYLCPKQIDYYSKRYDKYVTVIKDYPSDGASGAIDINSTAWWVHDVLCDKGTFDDGSECNNWQASMILRDILWNEGFWFRSLTWRPMTHLFGGGKARDNGMF